MSMPGLLDNGRWKGLVLVSLLILAQGAAAGLAAFATRGLFDAMHSGLPLFPGLLGLLAGSGLVIGLSRVGARLVGERLGQTYSLAIRLALLEHAASMPASAVANRRGGYMSLRFVGDMTAFRNWLGQGLPQLIAGAIMLPSACIVLWWLNPAFAVVIGPIFGVALVVLALAGMRLELLHRRLRSRRGAIAADMAERMPLAPQLDRLGRRPSEMRSLKRKTKRMVRASLDRLFWSESLRALSDLVAALAACGIILAGATAEVSSGGVAGALAVVGLIVTPLRDLASVWNFRAAHIAARGKCTAALQRQSRGLYVDRERLPKGPVSLSIRDLALPSGVQLSLDAPPGVDESLTCDSADADIVFAALCGLERLEPGEIMLSGICLTKLSRGSLRRSVHHVGSTPVVLKGSLRRNLTLGLRRRPADAVLEETAILAGLEGVLQRIGGLDGKLAEGGRNLSTNELNCLALARLLLAKPKLVLLGATPEHPSKGLNADLWAHLRSTGATVLRHPDLAA